MKNNKSVIGKLFLAGLIFVFAAINVQAKEYDALKGLKSIKAVFDVRAGNPKSAALQLDLILQTYKDKNIRDVTPQPEFIVVFIGPAVKLVSTDTKNFSPEEQEYIGNIAQTIKEMAREGIRLEICIFAASVMGIEPTTILPEIKHVGNGWISIIGFQAQGYTLVPVY
ncbi:MAG: DsrE family protein [Desulfobulbales bacterium]